MKDFILQVTSQQELVPGVFSLTLKGFTQEYEPGQFVQVEVAENYEPFLRRPISICDVEDDNLQLVYRLKGRGTKLLAKKKTGDKVRVLGPIGYGFPIEGQRATLIGGGIGVPPLLGLAKKMHSQGMEVTALLGFKNQAEAILLPEFAKYGNLQVATLDGSLGHKGLVTELITNKDDLVYACGPEGLFRTLETLGVKGYYSLEKRMACGVGVCLGCNITVIKEEKELRQRVCHDGPVFPIGSVKWGD